MSASVKSATASWFAPKAMAIATPWRVAAPTSIMSEPTPKRATIRRSRAAWNTRSV